MWLFHTGTINHPSRARHPSGTPITFHNFLSLHSTLNATLNAAQLSNSALKSGDSPQPRTYIQHTCPPQHPSLVHSEASKRRCGGSSFWNSGCWARARLVQAAQGSTARLGQHSASPQG